MQGVRDYIKLVKRGYARTTHLTSIDIRKNSINRDDAKRLVEEFEGQKPKSLELFLEFLKISENELNEIMLSQAIDPWEGKIPVKIGKAPSDYLNWQKKLLDS